MVEVMVSYWCVTRTYRSLWLDDERSATGCAARMPRRCAAVRSCASVPTAASPASAPGNCTVASRPSATGEGFGFQDGGPYRRVVVLDQVDQGRVRAVNMLR